MRMTIRRWQAALMGGVVLGWLGGARVAAYAQSLLWLGALDGRASEARGVSADGTVVVGIHYNQNDNPRAFRWTRTGGMELLPNLGGLTSAAHAVSADGVLTVGWADDERGYPRAALWVEDGGGFLPRRSRFSARRMRLTPTRRTSQATPTTAATRRRRASGTAAPTKTLARCQAARGARRAASPRMGRSLSASRLSATIGSPCAG